MDRHRWWVMQDPQTFEAVNTEEGTKYERIDEFEFDDHDNHNEDQGDGSNPDTSD
jgi:hypothetical protein